MLENLIKDSEKEFEKAIQNSIEKRKQERLFFKEKELQKTKREFKKVLDELKEL